jgi:hypothetical protein
LITRAMVWVGVKDDGGVDVSSAVANMLRFGRPMFDSWGNESVTAIKISRTSRWQRSSLELGIDVVEFQVISS